MKKTWLERLEEYKETRKRRDKAAKEERLKHNAIHKDPRKAKKSQQVIKSETWVNGRPLKIEEME